MTDKAVVRPPPPVSGFGFVTGWEHEALRRVTAHFGNKARQNQNRALSLASRAAVAFVLEAKQEH